MFYSLCCISHHVSSQDDHMMSHHPVVWDEADDHHSSLVWPPLWRRYWQGTILHSHLFLNRCRAAKPAAEKPLTVYNAHVMLSVIEFFICHGHVMMHDIGPAMKVFFHEHLTKFRENFPNLQRNFLTTSVDDPYLGFELFQLYTKNREKILFQSNIFSVHFLPLFKVFAWSPRSYYRWGVCWTKTLRRNRDIKYLLPCFLSARTCLEIFHHIIDLPLVAALLEKSQNEKGEWSWRSLITSWRAIEGSADSELSQGSNSSFGNYRELVKRSSSMRDNLVRQSWKSRWWRWSSMMKMRVERKQMTYRVLYNHFLRNENGVTVNLWDSISSLVDQFATVSPVFDPRTNRHFFVPKIWTGLQDVPPSQRVSDVCFLCPSLLDKFFEVMIENTDTSETSWQDLWTELLPIMFRRLSQIYPLASYRASIRKVSHRKSWSHDHGHHAIILIIF